MIGVSTLLRSRGPERVRENISRGAPLTSHSCAPQAKFFRILEAKYEFYLIFEPHNTHSGLPPKDQH